MTILELMDDLKLLGKHFRRGALGRDSWRAWRVFLAAIFGLPLTGDDLATFQKHTGRGDPPTEQATECYAIVGRRGGKSVIAALIAVFLSCCKDYSQILGAGEPGVFMVLASDRRQARVIFAYVNAFLQSSPLLKSMVRETLKESIVLSNGITIEIHSSNYKSVRGFTLVGCVADEIAFWPSDDSANPDTETLNALRPGMATVPGSLLLAISSPYAKRGALYSAYRDHYGKPSDVLVWKASSREMNPGLSRLIVASAYLRDAAAARAEYGGEFRDDLADFISLETVEACVVAGRLELPPVPGKSYYAFCDPSGGRSDSMTLAIAHVEGEKAVLDFLRETEPPFSPEAVVADFSDNLRRYRISAVSGDAYGTEWVTERFLKRSIQYRPAPGTRSELYLECLPLLTSGQCELLDNKRLIAQFTGLERRTGRGHDTVDHKIGGHDDVSNVVAGALSLALRSAQMHGLFQSWRRQAEALEKGEPEQVSGEQQNTAAIENAVASHPSAAVVFGRQARQVVPTVRVQTQTMAASPVCPECGNKNIARCGVAGLSGEVRESCACGWERIVPRPVVTRRAGRDIAR